MRKKSLVKKTVAVLLASTVAAGGASLIAPGCLAPLVSSSPSGKAHAATYAKGGYRILKKGTWVCYGKLMKHSEQVTLQKAKVKGNLLCLSGELDRYGRNGDFDLNVKGKVAFRLSKKCKYGMWQSIYYPMSKKQFVKKFIKTRCFPGMVVKVKKGKAVEIWTHT